MKRLFLGLVIHNHQPVGNFPWVLEQAYRQAYLPFLEALERHPGLRLSLHYSGPLWDWLKENRPEFIQRVARLVKREQVEMVGGGYYEPIMPLIPDADKAGQIALMRRGLARDLGAEATGLWLAERVWEPHLPKPLAQAGVEWTVVDDVHFKMVGFEEQDLLGYYLTEEQGYYLKVYGTSQRLRYLIPWKSVAEVLDYLRSLASENGQRIAVMGDDGEKFGTWPGTYEHCWEKGWIESFFTALEESREWLETIPLGEYARRFPALGPAYLPNASYAEMMEWALPAQKSAQFVRLRQEMEANGRQDILPYLRGGFWRHFLVKYPEVNRVYKKMLRVHRKVHRAAALSHEETGLHELWKGQCNCSYWHGVFGGVYLADIRAADYHHLIRAETWADALLRPSTEGLRRGNGGEVEVQREDFDGDGLEELLVEGEKQNLYLHLARGGTIFEWDLRPQAHNLLSTMTRRPEAYHLLLEAQHGDEAKEGEVETIHAGIRVKDKALPPQLSHDWYQRGALIDHFLGPGVTREEFARCQYDEAGDFVDHPYQVRTEEREGSLVIVLRREGQVSCPGRWLPFTVEKELDLAGSELRVRYRLTNLGAERAEGRFGSEWNLNLLGGGHNPQAFFDSPAQPPLPLDSAGEVLSLERLALVNRGLGVRLSVAPAPAAQLWFFPIETVSNSEGGLERVYQATCLLFLYPFSLAPGESTEFGMRWWS